MFLFGEKGGCFLGVRLFGVVRLLIFDLWSGGYDYLGWYVYLEVYSTFILDKFNFFTVGFSVKLFVFSLLLMQLLAYTVANEVPQAVACTIVYV